MEIIRGRPIATSQTAGLAVRPRSRGVTPRPRKGVRPAPPASQVTRQCGMFKVWTTILSLMTVSGLVDRLLRRVGQQPKGWPRYTGEGVANLVGSLGSREAVTKHAHSSRQASYLRTHAVKRAKVVVSALARTRPIVITKDYTQERLERADFRCSRSKLATLVCFAVHSQEGVGVAAQDRSIVCMFTICHRWPTWTWSVQQDIHVLFVTKQRTPIHTFYSIVSQKIVRGEYSCTACKS